LKYKHRTAKEIGLKPPFSPALTLIGIAGAVLKIWKPIVNLRVFRLGLRRGGKLCLFSNTWRQSIAVPSWNRLMPMFGHDCGTRVDQHAALGTNMDARLRDGSMRYGGFAGAGRAAQLRPD
jgi:hypothetical protein